MTHTETVTEGQYTRAFLYSTMVFLSGCIFAGMSIVLMAVSYPSFEYLQAVSTFALLSFTFYFFSFSAAVKRRGFNHKLWIKLSSVLLKDLDEPFWTLEDIDTDDFANGPVEVKL